MQPLNAIDAIAPAFTRTHAVLFRPFRVGRSWKLAASQYLGLVGAFFVPMPLLLAFAPLPDSGLPLAHGPLVALLSVATLIFFGFFYLGVRMQFVDFEMMVTETQTIAPMWRRYSARVWPVIGVKAVFGTVATLALVPLLKPAFLGMFDVLRAMPHVTPGVQPDPQAWSVSFQDVFAHMAGIYAIFFAAFLLIKLFTTTFEDFVQPFYILEDISLGEACRRGFSVVGADPLQCAAYLGLKLILSVIGFIVQYATNIVVMIPVVIVGMIAAFAGVLMGFLLHGTVGHLLGIGLGALLYVALLVVLFWYQIGSLGYLAALLEAYGVYFLGGRYPLLGNMLEPGPGAPFTPPPVFPSVEEQRDDDDGGPPMPMNPAVA